MRTKLSLTVAAALLAGSVSAASAADMAVRAAPPPPPVYDWTGWSLGFGFGGLWGDSDWTFLNAPAANTFVSPGFDQPMVSVHGSHMQQFGGFGWGAVVIGIDQSAAFPLDNTFGTLACPGAGFTCGARINSLFTTGAILGLAWDRILLSARGGWAGGSVNTRTTVTATGAIFDHTRQWHNGWYAGAALDWAVYKTAGTSGIIGVEYQHVDLGDAVHPGGVVVPFVTRRVDVTADTVKAKFTLKFDGPPLLPF
jgi:outer membrane immunogenic protein